MNTNSGSFTTRYCTSIPQKIVAQLHCPPKRRIVRTNITILHCNDPLPVLNLYKTQAEDSRVLCVLIPTREVFRRDYIRNTYLCVCVRVRRAIMVWGRGVCRCHGALGHVHRSRPWPVPAGDQINLVRGNRRKTFGFRCVARTNKVDNDTIKIQKCLGIIILFEILLGFEFEF